jgi:hypothetical protein
MSKVSDLTELKRKTFLATIQDGLDELLGGIFILIVAGMYLDLLFYIVLLLVIGLRNRILEGMRKKYTYKRIGRVNRTGSTASRNIRSMAKGVANPYRCISRGSCRVLHTLQLCPSRIDSLDEMVSDYLWIGVYRS